MTPFIFIIFLTVVTFTLGLILVLNNLFFAGAVLIIVNAGAIAMVFLFVCVLSSRKTTVNRSSSVFITLVNSLVLLFFFWFANVLFVYKEGALTTKSDLYNHFVINPDAFSALLSFSDWSVASHLLLIENNSNNPGILFLLGIILLISMCVAILITKRTLKSGF
jgi:NADH:ubiquinone oxidoreductase subunit 6 (subunit J)